ncbi:MAG: GNAT family N-acetyltransferase [Clostridia bacterium]|nr:GNAT family N-acetyltransferase [Clostridia bacterium]
MITIRKTLPAEAETLAAIQKEAFLPLYERYRDGGSPFLRGVEDVSGRLDSPYFRYFTIFENGGIVGGVLYKCKGKCPFGELEAGEYYLQRVYVRPERQGRRVAQTAILLCEKEFPDAKKFSVDFPEELVKNRRCYEKAGFCDTGRRLEAEPGLVLAVYEKHVDNPAEA